MATITCYPLGNADCTLIHLDDGRLVLIDFCHRRDAEDDGDKRADLPVELRSELERTGKDEFDAVAFTHADDDHVHGAEDLFWLEHAEKYQSRDRIKIRELWLPACAILEPGLESSAKAIRSEGRHRLRRGKGIRVFGNPGCLDEWLREQGIDPKERKHLVTHAGECVPGLSDSQGGAEIFVHSPFSFRMEGEDIDRNNASLVLHVTFFRGQSTSRVMLGGDAEHEAWSGIVYKTRDRGRAERLRWDAFRVSHHCSYTPLGPEKGKDTTEPVKEVAYLFEQGEQRCLLVSSSDIIPDKNTKMPPHRQAASFYRGVARGKEGDFLVTMSSPDSDHPEPIVIEVTPRGLCHRKTSAVAVGAAGVLTHRTPRLGC